MGVQEEPLQAEAAHLLVEAGIAILFVAGNRVTGVAGVNPDLVRASGLDLDLEQGRSRAKELCRLEYAHGLLATGCGPHMALAAAAMLGLQRYVDALFTELPVASNQGEIALLHGAVADQRMQLAERLAIARDQQAAAGVAVQPMHEFQRFARPLGPQRLDDAKAQAAAAMDGDARRLVERDEILVLEYDRLAQLLAHRPGRRDLRRGLEAHWRDPDTVACLEAMFRLDAAAAYPDLAFA